MKAKKWRLLIAAGLCAGLCLGAGCDDDDDDDGTQEAGSSLLVSGESGGGEAAADSDVAVESGNDAPVDVGIIDAVGEPVDLGDGNDDGGPAPAPLAAPVLVQPNSGDHFATRAGQGWCNLVWNEVEGAESYRIQVAGNEFEALPWYVFRGPPGTYRWRVAAVRGDEKVWSEERVFTFNG